MICTMNSLRTLDLDIHNNELIFMYVDIYTRIDFFQNEIVATR